MLSMKKRTAFLSYARRDMQDSLHDTILSETIAAVQNDVNGRLGGEDFSFWLDKEKLRLGDDWRQNIRKVLSDCNFLVVLVSPSFLRSSICREEYDAFVEFHPNAHGRIMPILLRKVPQGVPRISQVAYQWLAEIQIYQRNDWTSLVDHQNQFKRQCIYRMTSAAICEQINVLDNQEGPKHAPQRSPRSSLGSDERFDLAMNAEHLPVASGYYSFASQSPESVLGNVAFLGQSYVNTEKGTVRFVVSDAMLTTKVQNAQIVDANINFGADGWSGPVASVRRVNASPFVDILHIQAVAKGLKGEALCAAGEAGLVRLFDIKKVSEDALAPVLHGTLSIEVNAVITFDDEDGPSAAKDAECHVKSKLAKLVHKKLGLDQIIMGELTGD